MATTLYALFSNRTDTENAVNQLQGNGYNPKDISVIMRDQENSQTVADNTGANVASGAASGATTGGVIGAIAGLLIGVGAIAIPGIGGLLIGGPIAAALGLSGAAATTATGALTGALAGGLVGALVGLGIPEEEAREYENRIKEGGILLAVPVKEDEATARNILNQNNAEKISEVAQG